MNTRELRAIAHGLKSFDLEREGVSAAASSARRTTAQPPVGVDRELVQFSSSGVTFFERLRRSLMVGLWLFWKGLVATFGLMIGIAAWCTYLSPAAVEREGAKNLAEVQSKVARDAVAEYEIAKRQGDHIQICVQAGLVAAAFLQAQMEADYRQWKRVETEDCGGSPD